MKKISVITFFGLGFDHPLDIFVYVVTSVTVRKLTISYRLSSFFLQKKRI